MTPLPEPRDVLAAAARIAPHARATPVLRSRTLDEQAGCALHFKAEPLQRAGAFKFRGACNAVWAMDDATAARGVVTHSSGNHGGALALAARTRGIACHVVVPEGAVRAKLAAIEAYGAILHRCAPTIEAREARCAEVQAATGASLVHPYTDPLVIAGQGTAALELLACGAGPFDALVVPVGGGGLASGTCLAVAAATPGTRVVLAEPAGAAETAASLARGERVTEFTPDTVCDGLRGTLGDCWDRYWVKMQEMKQCVRILRQCIAQMPDGALLVSDEQVGAIYRVSYQKPAGGEDDNPFFGGGPPRVTSRANKSIVRPAALNRVGSELVCVVRRISAWIRASNSANENGFVR